ncbi:MAG: UDP-N-acetylmuramate dehydrogenase [Eggerthellaceae bacterium]|nr:UDP-N-acetylmuramate dehydrogenase [Eggerthellaceae bacterium]
MARHASPLQSLLVGESFDGDVYAKEPMAAHTTYRIGGPARFLVRVNSVGALSRLICVCNENSVSYMPIGRGSNLLVSDEGYRGVVIMLGRDFRQTNVDRDSSTITVGAGVPLSAAVQEAFQKNLSGLEFAVGTPGSMGGAVRMNAGSAKEWMGSVITSVTTIRPDGQLHKYAASDIDWGYRSTSIPEDEVVVECELRLSEADPFFIRGKMEANLSRRKASQPLNERSCGSVFRNPEGGKSAGQLIDSLGLKGMSCGDAQISEMHANFIINKGSAKAADVVRLIQFVQSKVYESYGITLKPEVRFVGFE